MLASAKHPTHNTRLSKATKIHPSQPPKKSQARTQKSLTARRTRDHIKTNVRTKKRLNSIAKAPTSSSSGTTKAPSARDFGGIGKLLTPKSVEESIGTITTLRTLSRNIMRYVQQADTLLETLFVTANSLKETGVLKKLAESKGKNLNSTDFTNILMALMNSPLGNGFFKRLGGNSTEIPATSETVPAVIPQVAHSPGTPRST